MKLVFALLSLLGFASASHEMIEMPTQLKADSNLGRKLMSQARRLNNDGDYEDTWVAGYSIVFQGCHHISQWNDEADDEDDVRIATKRLVRFRLCPSDTCTANACSSNYGDYIIDMNTYLKSWFEARQEYQQFKCEYLEDYVCNCDEANNENYSEEMCLWDCFAGHNMEGLCMDNNPYANDDEEAQAQQLKLEDYMECSKANLNNRRLQNNNQEWDGSYYIGPYCASQGGAIFLGMFTDDACSNFADSTGGRQTYYDITLKELPYGDANVVDLDCLSCKEPKENNNDGNDADDGDEVSEVCELLHSYAGKCEQNLAEGVTESPNNNACNYMEGIKIVRKDGTVVTADARANKTAAVFIGVFVVSFILLSAYSYFLKTKLDRASINLAE